MTQQPPRKPRARPTPPAGQPAGARRDAPASERGSESDRPTVNPPFDVEAFARASALAPTPAEASRVPPGKRHGAADKPTMRPPLPDGTVPEPRAEQITLTNEVELERARAQSAGMTATSALEASTRRTTPPRSPTPGAPNRPSPLSMANARAPSAPNVPVARHPSPSSIEAAVLGAIGNAGPEI